MRKKKQTKSTEKAKALTKTTNRVSDFFWPLKIISKRKEKRNKV